VDLNKDENGRATFYLLQIKPLIGSAEDYQIDEQKLTRTISYFLLKKAWEWKNR